MCKTERVRACCTEGHTSDFDSLGSLRPSEVSTAFPDDDELLRVLNTVRTNQPTMTQRVLVFARRNRPDVGRRFFQVDLFNNMPLP